jgi:acyl-CoA synthetase (AMP-forming)/AMP-acid ligase II
VCRVCAQRLQMHMDHICELLDDLARRLPERPAIVAPDGEQRTFRALRQHAAQVSGRLDALGVGRHVLLLIPVGIPLYEILLGVFWGGRTAVLVDPSLPQERLNPALECVGVDAFIAIPKGHLLRLKVSSLRGLGRYLSTRSLGPVARSVWGGPVGERRLPDDDEPALLTFTTGTTGVPKAMGRSHRFLLAQHDLLAGHMGLAADDVDLPTLPVFLLNSLAVGATCVLPDGDLRDVASLSPAVLTRQVRQNSVTTSSGSPGFFAPWVRWLQAEKQTLPELKKLFTGGARVPASLLRDMQAVFPSARIEVLYGSTEAEPMASINAAMVLDETAEREGAGEGSCVGAPVPGLAVRLVDPDSGDDVTDGPGEVWVCGDHVNQGYYNNAEADHANKVHDGDQIWHRTGDAAWRDETGRLWLVGRTSARVGELYPFPTETLVEALEGVERAALMDVGGAVVLAFSGVASRSDVQPLVPNARVVHIERMPLDPRHRAKIDRVVLRELLLGQHPPR